MPSSLDTPCAVAPGCGNADVLECAPRRNNSAAPRTPYGPCMSQTVYMTRGFGRATPAPHEPQYRDAGGLRYDGRRPTPRFNRFNVAKARRRWRCFLDTRNPLRAPRLVCRKLLLPLQYLNHKRIAGFSS